ncbi:MAG TPA: hypothetical protein VF060_17165 [Trebonia sp.]
MATAAAAAAITALIAGCGSATAGSPASPASPDDRGSALPLAAATSTGQGTWGIVEMGGSAASENNFWQLFTRPAGSTRWSLVTPPGVADNGGMAMAPAGTQSLAVGFQPSQDLRFSPLATTADGGRTWSSGVLDAGLDSVPDSLAVASGSGRELALLTTGSINQAAAGGASWSTLAAAGSVAASPGGKNCALGSLDAVAVSPAGAPLAAGGCGHAGVAGIFRYSGGTWQAASPVMPGSVAKDQVKVLRLTSTATGNIAVLLAGGSLFAAWTGDGGGHWTLSPPLPINDGDVASAAFGPASGAGAGGQGHGGAVGVLLTDGRASTISGPGSAWQSQPATPPDTAVLAFPQAGPLEALAAKGSTLTVWQLAAAGKWTSTQTIKVPIAYGSSG